VHRLIDVAQVVSIKKDAPSEGPMIVEKLGDGYVLVSGTALFAQQTGRMEVEVQESAAIISISVDKAVDFIFKNQLGNDEIGITDKAKVKASIRQKLLTYCGM